MSFWYPNLSEEQVAQSIRENRLAIPPNWSTKVFSALFILVYWGFCGYFVVNAPTTFYRILAAALFPFLGWLFFYAVYCQLRENRLTTLETGLSAEANWQLVVRVFQELNWNIQQNTPQMVRAFPDGYIRQVGVAFIQPGKVLLNVLHLGHRRGRFPFSFGLNEKALQLLVSRINQHLAATGPPAPTEEATNEPYVYRPQISWRGASIGVFDTPRPDMWYLEGPWLSNNTEAAREFERQARALHMEEVYRDLNLGIEIFLTVDSEKPLRAVVIGLQGERCLFVRQMID